MRRMSGEARYAAKLLFQFRVGSPRSAKMRMCEERIVLLRATSSEDAHRSSVASGLSSQYDYLNNDGERVFFEFIGVRDLISLGVECEEDEVWYEIKTMLRPMERRKKLIPPRQSLSAFKKGKK